MARHLLLVLLALAGCGDSSAPEDQAAAERIVFARSPAQAENWAVAPEGGIPSPLIAPGFTTMWELAVSHDRQQIAFVGWPDGSTVSALYVAPLTPDGLGTPRMVGDWSDSYPSTPRWSPDGRLLAVSRWPILPGPFDFPELWVLSPAGGVPRLISIDAGEADWSPDGTQLVFSAYVQLSDLYYRRPTIVGLDGTGRVDLFDRLCPSPCVDAWRPHWSSSGSLVVLRYRTAPGESGSYELAVAPPGAAAAEVVWSSGLLNEDFEPTFAWDPAGANRLVLARAAGRGTMSLYLVDVASRNQVAITEPLYYHQVWDWQ